MADYKTCVNYDMDLCPMARKFANKKGVKLDCSNCKDYLSSENKCGDCKHYAKKHRRCYLKSKSEFIADLCPACGNYEEKQEEKEQKNVAAAICEAQNHDAVNHPSHYTAGGIECIEALKAATTRLTGIEAVCTANAIKYLWRWKDKNGAEDIRKAIWYCERLLKEIGDEER